MVYIIRSPTTTYHVVLKIQKRSLHEAIYWEYFAMLHDDLVQFRTSLVIRVWLYRVQILSARWNTKTIKITEEKDEGNTPVCAKQKMWRKKKAH